MLDRNVLANYRKSVSALTGVSSGEAANSRIACFVAGALINITIHRHHTRPFPLKWRPGRGLEPSEIVRRCLSARIKSLAGAGVLNTAIAPSAIGRTGSHETVHLEENLC